MGLGDIVAESLSLHLGVDAYVLVTLVSQMNHVTREETPFSQIVVIIRIVIASFNSATTSRETKPQKHSRPTAMKPRSNRMVSKVLRIRGKERMLLFFCFSREILD